MAAWKLCFFSAWSAIHVAFGQGQVASIPVRGRLTAMAASPKGDMIVTLSTLAPRAKASAPRGALELFTGGSNSLIWTNQSSLEVAMTKPSGMVFDGNWVVMSVSQNLFIWQRSNRMLVTVGVLTPHIGDILDAELSPDGRLLAVSGKARGTGALIYDLASFQMKWQQTPRPLFTVASSSPVTSIAFRPDSGLAALGTLDGSATFYLENGTQPWRTVLATMPSDPAAAGDTIGYYAATLRYSADGSRLAFAKRYKGITVYKTSTQYPTPVNPTTFSDPDIGKDPGNFWITSIVFMDNLLAVGMANSAGGGDVRIWSPQGVMMNELPDKPRVAALAYLPGAVFATAPLQGNAVLLWASPVTTTTEEPTTTERGGTTVVTKPATSTRTRTTSTMEDTTTDLNYHASHLSVNIPVVSRAKPVLLLLPWTWIGLSLLFSVLTAN